MNHIPRKRFGQHFLHDQTVIQHILQALQIQPEQHVVEIGPGLGALTTWLTQLTCQLSAIELDRDLIPKLAPYNLNLYQADALTFDFAQLGTKLRVVGNLPYNIATPLLFKLLQFLPHIQDMHFMLQKEVAQRLAAQPNTKAYGRLSVMLQYACNVDFLFVVGREAFEPPPKVASAFVRITPSTPQDIAQNPQHFSDIVRLAFNQRRKTIHNNLKTVLTEQQLRAINIDPKLRPEQLSVAQFVKISNLL